MFKWFFIVYQTYLDYSILVHLKRGVEIVSKSVWRWIIFIVIQKRKKYVYKVSDRNQLSSILINNTRNLINLFPNYFDRNRY